MIYCDAHCHLGSRQFDEDREQMLERMMENKVKKAIVICCSRHDLEYGIRLREMNPDFKLAMAIHPQDLEDDHNETRLERFVRLAEETKPDMIGETGLDYYSHPHTKDHQQHFFIEQLKLAQKLKLPVDIHSRKASNDTLQILKQYPVKGIIHSYSGSIEMARLYMKEGFYISFGASVLFKDAKKPKEEVHNPFAVQFDEDESKNKKKKKGPEIGAKRLDDPLDPDVFFSRPTKKTPEWNMPSETMPEIKFRR